MTRPTLDEARAALALAKVANQDANAAYAVALGGPGECDEFANCCKTAKRVNELEDLIVELEDEEHDRRQAAKEAYEAALLRPAKVACADLSKNLETRIRQLEAAE